jgi:hypothetical protein
MVIRLTGYSFAFATRHSCFAGNTLRTFIPETVDCSTCYLALAIMAIDADSKSNVGVKKEK